MKEDDIKIEVGIATSGKPRLRRIADGGRVLTLLENQRIGIGFHWQQDIESLLPGEVREVECEERGFTLINRLGLEEYLQCVVGSEMNPAAPPEFLKAHAIISRSWAVGKLRRFRHGKYDGAEGKRNIPGLYINWEDSDDHREFDVCADDHCQRYQGVQKIPQASLEAINATAGLVLTTPAGDIVDARFSKCCGGRTELFSTCWQEREKTCLESFDDPWCDTSKLSPEERRRVLESVLKDYDMGNGGGYRWEERVEKRLIEENLRNRFAGIDFGIGRVVRMDGLERGPSGRMKYIKVKGTEGELTLGKELMIRRLLSASHLYSSAFEIVGEDEEVFYLRGKGWGHGVGLCQIGAARMALEGHTAPDILRFYYPNSTLANLRK